MNTSSHFYNGEADLKRMKEFLIAARADGAKPGYWHIGDLLWALYQNVVYDPFRNVRLWENEVGKLLGFALYHPPDSVDLIYHPVHDDGWLQEQMLTWAEEHRKQFPVEGDAPASLSTGGLDNDPQHIAILERRSFRRTEHHFVNLLRDLAEPIPETVLPEGVSVRPVAGEAEFEERVSIHREVWHPSRVTLEAYRRMRTMPGYTPELDLVAVTPNDTFASYCICWIDPVNKCGEFEPVGTRPAFRQKGLGKAVMLEGLRQLKALGMETAIVASSGSNQASLALYQSVGFQIINRDYEYVRKL
jgi:GNAT superfamily N-acetyltransferase